MKGIWTRAKSLVGKENNEGAALLISIIIMTVVMMLGLTMLLAVYSLHSTASRQHVINQNHELAKSIGAVIEKDIVSSPADRAADPTAYPIWTYLDAKIWTNEWPCYDSEVRGHTKEYAYRYFTVDFTTFESGVSAADKTSVQSLMKESSILMYWKLPSDLSIDDMSESSQKSGTTLYVVVTCGAGGNKSTVTRHYELKVEEDGTKTWFVNE